MTNLNHHIVQVTLFETGRGRCVACSGLVFYDYEKTAWVHQPESKNLPNEVSASSKALGKLQPRQTPFDNPKSLMERLAYPLARLAYQSGRSDGWQQGFNEGITLAEYSGAEGLRSPKFSARNRAWLRWKAKWAEKEPSQHDYWVFDEGL